MTVLDRAERGVDGRCSSSRPERARGLLAVGRAAAPTRDRRAHRAGGRPLRARRPARRSTRSSAPTGTSSHGRPRPSRARLALAAISRDRRAGLRRGRAAHARASAQNFAYGIMRAAEARSGGRSRPIYAFAREVDDIADGDAAGRREACGPARAAGRARRAARGDAMFVALADARARFPIPDAAAARPRRRRPAGHRAGPVRRLRRAVRLLPQGRGRGRRRLRRASTAPTSRSAPRRSASPSS